MSCCKKTCVGISFTLVHSSQLPSSDVEQLHDIAMEFIKEEQEAQAWNSLPLDCNVDLDSLDAEVPGKLNDC